MFKNVFLTVFFLVFLNLTSALAFDLIETDWASFKSFKSRDIFSVSYIAFPQGTIPETYQYRVYGANTAFYFKSFLTLSDEITDFETNFKSSAISVGSEEQAVSNSRVPTTKVGSINTTTTTALQTVISYTVPANQTFHCEQWMASRLNTGSAEISIAQLQVNGVVVDGQTQSSLQSTPSVDRKYAHPLPLANAGDVVTIKITPSSGSGSTLFGARILGELR